MMLLLIGYPFGLKHKGYNNVITGRDHKKQFADKELEEELGLNTIAYGMRDYDPALGRFNKIDRFAEKYRSDTPYHYTLNNPILFREIQGDSVWAFNESISSLGGMATHAFLRVKTDKVDVTIELTGQIEGAKTGRPAKKKFSKKWFKNGRGKVSDAMLIEPKGKNENYEFENSILELFEIFTEQDENGVYVNLPDYNATGPNSNGFVVSLVKDANGGVEIELGPRGFGENDTEDYDRVIYNNILDKTNEERDRVVLPIPWREHPGSAGSADDHRRNRNNGEVKK
jgi:RHS repeat-associated protein